MSGEKFTKGEWCIRTSKQIEAKCIVHYVNGGKMPLSEGIANANLITCAPEMYRMIEILNIELHSALVEANLWRNRLINLSTVTPPDLLDFQTCSDAELLLAKARGEL